MLVQHENTFVYQYVELKYRVGLKGLQTMDYNESV